MVLHLSGWVIPLFPGVIPVLEVSIPGAIPGVIPESDRKMRNV